MKDLLKTCGSNTVLGLNGQAFALLEDVERKIVKRVELLPHKSIPTQENKKPGSNSNHSNEVQAVALSWCKDNRNLLCGISRFDKSLAIYSISLDDIGDKVQVDPAVVHKTNKRCCALTFASVPYEDESKGSLDVIVSGDYSGDVVAFPTEASSTSDCNKICTGTGRLLLGHTASIVTAIKTVGGKLFTSDRDEKVRISSFPKSYNVEGYLLGNEEYVTDFDAFDNNQYKYCVTSSGDCSIRLWDRETCAELASLNVHVAHEEDKDNEGGDEQKDNPEEISTGFHTTQIPVRVAAGTSGNQFSVVYNDKNVIDVFAIKRNSGGENCTNIEKIQSIQCTSPLAVAFDQNDDIYVLCKEPKYLSRFVKNAEGNFVANEECKIISSVREAGDSNKIIMPEAIIETDEVTGTFKLSKNVHDARQNFVKHEPWLNKDRVEKQKGKERRRKKRRLEEAQS